VTGVTDAATGITPEALRDLPGIPLDADRPVFNEPWEARAFAMTVALHERGLFTWPQWADALSRQIALAQAAGDADLGDTYYQHWLRALESLVDNLRRTGSEGCGA
jgi:nitrile hydratase accessory protein